MITEDSKDIVAALNEAHIPLPRFTRDHPNKLGVTIPTREALDFMCEPEEFKFAHNLKGED